MGLGSGHGVGTGVGGLALWRRLRRLGPAGSRRLHDQLRLLSTELVLCSGNALRRTRRVSLRASGRTLPRGVLRDQPYSRAGALWRNSVECGTSAGPGIPSGGSPDPAGGHHPAPPASLPPPRAEGFICPPPPARLALRPRAQPPRTRRRPVPLDAPRRLLVRLVPRPRAEPRRMRRRLLLRPPDTPPRTDSFRR